MFGFLLKASVIYLALAASVAACFPSMQLPDPPTYICKRALNRIVVDGLLNEKSWQKAEPMNLVLREGTGEPLHKTVTKAVWDNRALYLSFVCQDPEIWTTMTERDDPLWTEEVVEVFLDPNGNGDPYFEIEANPLNVVVDLRFMRSLKGLRDRRPLQWNCRSLQTAVRVKGRVNSWQAISHPDSQWTVEIAIPFEALDKLPNSPPKDGDSWKANFYRIERPASLAEEDDEYSCWSPIIISKSYHTLERFGTMIFSALKVGESKK